MPPPAEPPQNVFASRFFVVVHSSAEEDCDEPEAAEVIFPVANRQAAQAFLKGFRKGVESDEEMPDAEDGVFVQRGHRFALQWVSFCRMWDLNPARFAIQIKETNVKQEAKTTLEKLRANLPEEVVVEKVTAKLDVELSQEEKLDKMLEASRVRRECERELEDLKEEVKERKAAIASRLGKAKSLESDVVRGREYRDMIVEQVYDKTAGVKFKRLGEKTWDMHPLGISDYARGDKSHEETVEAGEVPNTEASLVASTDGTVTRIRTKRIQPAGPGMTPHPDSEIGAVMREEMNVKTRVDHTT